MRNAECGKKKKEDRVSNAEGGMWNVECGKKKRRQRLSISDLGL
jgi:hypothetical protein